MKPPAWSRANERSKYVPEFIFAHRFPNDFKGSPVTAAGATTWFQKLGDSMVCRSDPKFETRKLGDCGTDTHPAAYTIVSADNAEAALVMAGEWPLLEHGGGVEVRELTRRELDLTIRPPRHGPWGSGFGLNGCLGMLGAVGYLGHPSLGGL
jgi:hypothetical protein